MTHLDALKVLVTRPEHQQRGFQAMLEAAGATAIAFPCVEIEPIGPEADQNLQQATNADLLIFISANAVIEAHRSGNLPPAGFAGKVLAIGNSTANKLYELGLPVSANPTPPYNSESIIELIARKMNNLQNVAIIKGVGGRTVLEATLRRMGKTVTLIDVYRRKVPRMHADQINSVFLNSGPDIVTISSNETLQNLVLLAGSRFAGQRYRQ